MNDIRIELASDGDADMVAILVNQLVSESFDNDSRPSPKQIQESAEQLLMNGNAKAIIAYHHNEAVGVMTLTEAVAMHAKGKFVIIMEFFILPRARSLGIGFNMLKYVNDLAHKNQWNWIELSVPQGGDKEKSENFFIRNGFKNTGPSLRKHVNR